MAQGHTITENIQEAECVFFDMHSGYLPYDMAVLDLVLENRLPVVVFDAHDYHGNSTKNWYWLWNYKTVLDNDWVKFLTSAKDRCKVIYFMRKIQTDNEFPDWVYPYELCQFPDHDFPLVSKDELNSRPFDACFIGAESARRRQFVDALQKEGRLKLDIQFTTERIPHDEWLNRHRQAKFFIESDGGGLGSERPYQLMSISPMLKQKNNQLIVNNFEDVVDCVILNQSPSRFDIEDFQVILSEAETIYNIYMKGNERMKKHFSWQARANYILDTLKQNGVC